jgi:hypothetical protein
LYDLIGDIHGHADELAQLLEALGYKKAGWMYRYPDRKVIFLDDPRSPGLSPARKKP